jgi:tetratricopeptide (TPR) repeat protein
LVLCSPAAARSRWVAEEIVTFKRLHGEDRVLAVIVGGSPGASAIAGQEALECFPSGLRFRLGADGDISQELAHPIAADIRRNKDGRQLATLKLVAGLTGLRLDDLVQRESQRRVRRLSAIAVASFAGMVLAGGLAFYANAQRIEADRQRNIAQRETATAQAASDYLIGTYKLINPATENPRSISALTLLGRGAERARVELADQPVIHAQLLKTLGEAYINLGLSREYVGAVARSLPAIRRAGPAAVGALLQLASAYRKLDRVQEAMDAVHMAEQAAGPPTNANRMSIAEIHVEKGSVLYKKSELNAGEDNLRAALAIYRGDPAAPPLKVAAALKILGLLLSDEGKYDAADAALRESLAIYRRVAGERHELTGTAWWALATNDLAANKLAPAEDAVGRSLSIERAVLDEDNPILGDSLSMQGQIYQGEHKLSAAAAALKEAISTYNKAQKGPSSQAGIALAYLALVDSERGNLAAALADFNDAKHNYDVGYGKLHPNHGDLLVNRATVLAKFGRRREALTDCAAGLKILNQTLGPDAAFTKSDADMCRKL